MAISEPLTYEIVNGPFQELDKCFKCQQPLNKNLPVYAHRTSDPQQGRIDQICEKCFSNLLPQRSFYKMIATPQLTGSVWRALPWEVPDVEVIGNDFALLSNATKNRIVGRTQEFAVTKLINAGVSLEDIVALSAALRRPILSYSQDVLALMNAGVSFHEIVALPDAISIAQILFYSQGVIDLMKAGVSFHEIVALPVANSMAQILLSSQDVLALMNAGVSFNEIAALPQAERMIILHNTKTVIDLKKAGTSFEEIVWQLQSQAW